MLRAFRYYGSSAISEKGQLVIPAELRRSFTISPGDKFLVLAGEKLGAWGIILVKSDVLAGVMRQILGADHWMGQKERQSRNPGKGPAGVKAWASPRVARRAQS